MGRRTKNRKLFRSTYMLHRYLKIGEFAVTEEDIEKFNQQTFRDSGFIDVLEHETFKEGECSDHDEGEMTNTDHTSHEINYSHVTQTNLDNDKNFKELKIRKLELPVYVSEHEKLKKETDKIVSELSCNVLKSKQRKNQNIYKFLTERLKQEKLKGGKIRSLIEVNLVSKQCKYRKNKKMAKNYMKVRNVRYRNSRRKVRSEHTCQVKTAIDQKGSMKHVTFEDQEHSNNRKEKLENLEGSVNDQDEPLEKVYSVM